MTIIIEPADITPGARGLNAMRLLAPILNVSAPNELAAICDCTCVYRTPVFASPGGTTFENDKNSFIFRTVLPGDTVVIELFKDGALLATIVDDTYGLYFPLGTFGSTAGQLPEQALYIGFLVEWEKVFTLEGPGDYQICATIEILGVETIFESEPFTLLPFTRLAADGTVRIDSLCNANVEASEFNFIGMNWFKSVRIYGQFGFKDPEYEKSTYFDTVRNEKQIQNKITNEYSLNTELLPGEITDRIIYEQMLGDEIEITDYTIKTNRPYVGVKVYPNGFEKDPVSDQSGNGEVYTIKFSDKKQNWLSRLYD